MHQPLPYKVRLAKEERPAGSREEGILARAGARAKRRLPLSRERVLTAAIGIVDQGGITALSMRKLAHELGVEVMSLYYHVKNKDEILTGMLEMVFSEIEPPKAGQDPMQAIRASAVARRDTLRRHPWVHDVTRSPERVTPAQLAYMEALLRTLREAGFSPRMTHHAYHILDSHIVGSTLWEAGIAAAVQKGKLPDLARTVMERLPVQQFPYSHEHLRQHVGELAKGDKSPFEFGLDLILDGLERLRDSA